MRQLGKSVYDARVRQLEWWSTLTMCGITAFGESLAIIADRQQGIADVVDKSRAAHVLMAVVGIGILLVLKKKSRRALTIPLYVIVFLPFFLISTLYYLEVGQFSERGLLFVGHKLFFLGLSVLIPGPLWINVFLMLLFAIQGIFLWHLSTPEVHQHFVTNAEPWATILYAVVAASLLVFRYRYQVSLKQIATLEARSEVLSRMTRIFLGVRDLANTPLQNILFAAQLIRNKEGGVGQDVVGTVERAAEQLKSLNRIFKHLEGEVEFDKRDVLSEDEIIAVLSDFGEKSEVGGR